MFGSDFSESAVSTKSFPSPRDEHETPITEVLLPAVPIGHKSAAIVTQSDNLTFDDRDRISHVAGLVRCYIFLGKSRKWKVCC